MKNILCGLLLFIVTSLSYAAEGFNFKFQNDFINQKLSSPEKDKTFMSNRVLMGVQAEEGSHYVALLYGQEYFQGFDPHDAMRLGYGYKISSNLKFKFYANLGYDLFLYKDAGETKSELINTATLMPQLHYFFGKDNLSSISLGGISQNPSEMKVSGGKGYVPVNAKCGLGYSVGINHSLILSPNLTVDLGFSYVNITRSTSSVADQVNEQMIGSFSFSYKTN